MFCLQTRRLLLTVVISSLTTGTTVVKIISGFVPTPKSRVYTGSVRPFLSKYRQAMASLDANNNINSNINNNNNSSSSSSKGLFLFDFDGVVCDSCDECTVSALRTCHQCGIFSAQNDNAPDYPPPWLFQTMREIRPAIEVGWQIPILLSVVLDQRQQEAAAAAAESGSGSPEEAMLSVDEIISNYEWLVNEWLMKRWKKTKQEMVEAFGSVRDAWIADDMTSWLEINKFYPGVPEALSNCKKGDAVLVTTKQQRFAIALCRHAGLGEDALPDDCIYGLGMYKTKSDVIAERMVSGGGYQAHETRFFEDRWPTLVQCLTDERLDGVRFYLCAWGYVTKDELELAKAEPRVEVISLDEFANIVSS